MHRNLSFFYQLCLHLKNNLLIEEVTNVIAANIKQETKTIKPASDCMEVMGSSKKHLVRNTNDDALNSIIYNIILHQRRMSNL